MCQFSLKMWFSLNSSGGRVPRIELRAHSRELLLLLTSREHRRRTILSRSSLFMKYPKDIAAVGIEVGYCPTLLMDCVFIGQIQSY
jgi:hypothetical protein